MKWAMALRFAWQAWKENRNVYEILNDISFPMENASQNAWIEMLATAYADKTLEKVAYYRLRNMVKNSSSMQNEKGEQVEIDLSVSAQKAFYRWGFYGFEESAYEDYLQNVALATTKLIRKQGYIESKIAERAERGENALNIANLIWYGSLIGWNMTLKAICNRMRNTAKQNAKRIANGNDAKRFEYFAIDSLDKSVNDADGNETSIYDLIDADSVKGQYGFSDKSSYFETWDAICSVCADETDFALAVFRRDGRTQTEATKYFKMTQQAISKRLKAMAKRYHESF
jgi:hypothetical protein